MKERVENFYVAVISGLVKHSQNDTKFKKIFFENQINDESFNLEKIMQATNFQYFLYKELQ